MSNLTLLLSVFASECDRIETSAQGVTNEFFPKTVTDLIAEWETAFGIDVVTGDPIATRRARLLAKIRATGGQSIEYFYTLSEAMGYNLHPSTTDPHLRIMTGMYPPFRAGISVAGDPVYDGGTGASIFTWRVTGTDVETDTYLQEIFNKYKPAHTEIEFVNS
jgi:uncharacterized protein YmfQ (DUF2313 family)